MAASAAHAAAEGARARRPRRGPATLLLAAAAAALAAAGCLRGGAGEGFDSPVALGLQLRKRLARHWLVKKLVQHHFPGAMPGTQVFSEVMKAVKPFGLAKQNVIYGQSICSDEINSDPGHISTLLTKYYGRNFPMGGIGGAPYVGKTGFMAFSHHVPKNGHVFVLFGPHIGFSPDGSSGQFLRLGQDTSSTSCGAAIAAYSQVTSGANLPADDSDMQQSWLRARLAPHCAQIEASAHPLVALAFQNYKVVEQEMVKIIATDYGPGNLVLLGGIQINMPYPMDGFFMPLHFSVRAQGMKPVDLMSTFGVLRPVF